MRRNKLFEGKLVRVDMHDPPNKEPGWMAIYSSIPGAQRFLRTGDVVLLIGMNHNRWLDKPHTMWHVMSRLGHGLAFPEDLKKYTVDV